MNSPQRLPDLDHISVIVPVKNEESSIGRLLAALAQQTYPPSEIVITDGGSSDRTREIVREHQASSPIPVVLIETEGSLPGRGRNLAISSSAHEWIASIDGGITPQPDWLAQLVAAARKTPEAEVVYGVAEPVTDTYFTECAAISYLPPGPQTQVIPSSLFRHSAWVKAGGFREDLRSAEDLLFMRRLDEVGAKTTRCPRAVVRWELSPSITSTFRRFVTYSRNSMKAGLAREWQYNVSRFYLVIIMFFVVSIWSRFFVLGPLLILLFRIEKRIWRWFRFHYPKQTWIQLLNPRRVLTVMWITLVIDLATFYGVWQWSMSSGESNAGKSGKIKY